MFRNGRLLKENYKYLNTIHKKFKGIGKYWESTVSPQDLILTESEQYRITAMVTRQGYLDGITQSTETVDNLSWDEHKKTHDMMTDYAELDC